MAPAQIAQAAHLLKELPVKEEITIQDSVIIKPLPKKANKLTPPSTTLNRNLTQQAKIHPKLIKTKTKPRMDVKNQPTSLSQHQGLIKVP